MLHDGTMTYVKVRDLQPGDVFVMDGTGGSATVIVTTPHPLHRSGRFALVVWWMHEERRYSFDALDWRQELPGKVLIGPIGGATQATRDRAWQEALREGNV